MKSILFFLHWVLFGFLFFHLKLFRPETPLQDFDAYMKLVSALRQGINPYTVNYMQTLGPPITFLYYYPFALLPLGFARILTTLLNFGALFATTWMIFRSTQHRYRQELWLLATGIFISSFPVRFALLMGQPTPLAALCVAVFLVYRGKPISSVAVTSLFYVKSIFLFPFFTLKKNMIPTGILVACIAFTSLLIIPLSTYTVYFQHTLTPILQTNGELSGTDYYNQSLKSTMQRIGQGKYYTFLWLILLCVSFGLLLQTQNRELSVLASILLSPIAWQHYFVILFPVALSLVHSHKDLWKFTLFLCLFWGQSPLFHLPSDSLLRNIGASHYFLSGLWLVLWKIHEGKSEKKGTIILK